MKKQPNPNRPQAVPKVHIGEAKDFFIENLAAMLDSGISITEALASLYHETHAKKLQTVVAYMYHEVDSGVPLWQTFKALQFLPEYAISLVKTGERSGTLSKNMRVIAVQQQKEASLRGKLRAAMAYPILVFSITIIVAVGISWFILPRFVTVFSNLGLTLPLTTRVLLVVGRFLGHYGTIAIPLFFLVLFFVFYFVFLNQGTRVIGEKFLWQFSVSRRIIQQTEVSQITFLLGTLLTAGIPIGDALASVNQTTSNHYYHDLLHHLEEKIDEGSTFRRAFDLYKRSDQFIPATQQQMISAAEKTGRLPETLLAISSAYEEKIDNSTKTMAATLEPILLVLIWLGVVFVAVSIILPIYSLIGGLDKATGPSAPAPTAVTSAPATPVSTFVSPSPSPSLPVTAPSSSPAISPTVAATPAPNSVEASPTVSPIATPVAQ